MSFEDVRARLNLFAVLPNLEDVVAGDPEMRALVADTRVTVRLTIANGPGAAVRFDHGQCSVGPVARKDRSGTAGGTGAAGGSGPTVRLAFTSAAHLNRMFDGKGQPIPYWGFNHLGFLTKRFAQLTDRMGYYLAPTDELLAHPAYLAMNTRLTLNTAAFAVPVLLGHDPECVPLRHGLAHGTIVVKVLPDGPAVSLVCGASGVLPVKGELTHPGALVLLKDLQTANDFLAGKLDTFVAAVTGDVQIRGRVAMVDTLALVLDRVGKYLQPSGAGAASAGRPSGGEPATTTAAAG
jgi:hypothetical protein